MLLTPEATKGKNIPKEYNMHLTNQDSTNTFLFSEKDLPGFKTFAQNQHFSRTDAFMGKNRFGKKKKGGGDAVRRTVPSESEDPTFSLVYSDTIAQNRPHYWDKYGPN